MRMKHIVYFLLLLSVLLWGIGLWGFIRSIPNQSSSVNSSYDAIIVLTGGEKRIDYGVELLQSDIAPILFITGVSDNYTRNELPVERQDTRIVYGNKARSTLQNVMEAQHWLTMHSAIKKIIVISANYHIPRVQLIFDYQLQGYNLHYATVSPSQFTKDKWYAHGNSLRLVLAEYHKYLITWVRLHIFGMVSDK